MRLHSGLLFIVQILTFSVTVHASDGNPDSIISPDNVFQTPGDHCFRIEESGNRDSDTPHGSPPECFVSATENIEPISTSGRHFENDLLRATEPMVIRAQNGGMFGAGTRLRFDYSEDHNDEVRIHGQLMTQLTGRFGLDAEATWYDKTRNSDIIGELWTGDANLVYELDVRRVTLRFGGGAAYALEDGNVDVGYNMTYGTDFYIRRPFLVSGEIDWGQISSDQLFHWRVTTGFVYGSLEVFAGYDSYELGEFEIDGPVAGLGIVF